MSPGIQAILFGFGFKILDWILESGYENIITGVRGVLAANDASGVHVLWEEDTDCDEQDVVGADA